jgi:TrmH family RNA methyltransferase
MKEITSVSNPIVRKIEQLQRKSRARKTEGLFIIEGQREVMLADQGGYEFDALFLCLDILQVPADINAQELYTHLNLQQEPEIVLCSREVYEKVAYRGGTEGCLAFAKAKSLQLSELKLSENPLILVAESPEKPGNLGALLRTADAAAVDAVIVVNPTTDLYNPNVIRSSVGCLFTVPVATGTAEEVIQFLHDQHISLYAATLQTSERYDLVDLKQAAAIAVGTESTGLTESLRNAATANVIIPMSGAIDSMNVSVSAAILLFEAKRQRDFK